MKDKDKIIEYWKTHALYDIETAESMMTVKRYPYCLFMCHLAIEKLLKGILVSEKDEHAPYTHNLTTLSAGTNIDFSAEQKLLIVTLNEFNMEARYPDWQDSFYSRATKDYTEKYLQASKELYLWLINYLQK